MLNPVSSVRGSEEITPTWSICQQRQVKVTLSVSECLNDCLDQRLVIAAIGEAGEGKSTLLDLILNSPGEAGGGKDFFEVSDEPEACTTSPTYRLDINKYSRGIFEEN